MEKNNKFGEVIGEAILRMKEEIEGTGEEMKQVKEQVKQIKGEKDRAIELQENTEFFKATLTLADSLIKTIELAKRGGREIDLVSMSEILTGVLVVLEERDFIRIIEED